MAKYIQKESLPCFKYLNPIPNNLMDTIVETLTYFVSIKVSEILTRPEEIQKLIDYAEYLTNDFAKQIFPDSAGINGIPKRLSAAIKSCKLLMETKDLNQQILTKRDLENVLHPMITESKRLLQVAMMGGALQGTYQTSDSTEDQQEQAYFPKLLLIEEDLFRQMQTGNQYDFYDLFRLFPTGIAFNTFVQSEKKVGKYGFCIRKYSDTLIYVSLWDRLCAGYTFVIEQAGDHSYAVYPKFTCTLRDGTICEKSKQRPCATRESDCPTKKLGTVRSVILCLQEYLIRKENAKPKKSKKKKQTVPETDTEKFRMEGQISVFDYYQNQNTIRFREPSDSCHKGYKVKPHIRSSHYRTLSDGTIVPVKAAIIHKEEYQGYESAERINP